MKNCMKKSLTICTLAVVALAAGVPAVGQDTANSGVSIHLTAQLQSPAIGSGSGKAEYLAVRDTIRGSKGPWHTRFTVECYSMAPQDGNKLDVFLGPGKSANEPYGKYVGSITIQKDGSGALILVSAEAPVVRDDTTVTVLAPGDTTRGKVALEGRF